MTLRWAPNPTTEGESRSQRTSEGLQYRIVVQRAHELSVWNFKSSSWVWEPIGHYASEDEARQTAEAHHQTNVHLDDY